jgi:hypothetical protein
MRSLPERDHHADGHPGAELERRDALAGARHHRLLTRDRLTCSTPISMIFCVRHVASPRPMLTVTFMTRGTCIGLV